MRNSAWQKATGAAPLAACRCPLPFHSALGRGIVFWRPKLPSQDALRAAVCGRRCRAHTREVQEQFESLFQYKALLFLEEMASTLLTPFVLYFSLPKCAGESLWCCLWGLPAICIAAWPDGSLYSLPGSG